MLGFALFLLTLVTTATAHRRCEFNCTCENDHACEFYCKGGQCQYAIPMNETCYGYEMHPRECGRHYWCNSTTKQCEETKLRNQYCEHDYECLSNHCGRKGFCKEGEDDEEMELEMLIPTVTAIIIFLVLIVVIISYQRRIAELHKRSAFMTIIHPNAGINMEVKPPPYTRTQIHLS